MSSFTDKQKNDVAGTARRRVIKEKANNRTQQNRRNRGEWSNECRRYYGKTEVPFPKPVA